MFAGSQRTSFTSYQPQPLANTNPFHSNSNQFNAATAAAVQQPMPSQLPPTFGQNHFSSGLPNQTANSQPWQVHATPLSTVNTAFNQQPPPKAFSPAPPPPLSHPPRPTSVGSSHGKLYKYCE